MDGWMDGAFPSLLPSDGAAIIRMLNSRSTRHSKILLIYVVGALCYRILKISGFQLIYLRFCVLPLFCISVTERD